jgi:hypothetical protein
MKKNHKIYNFVANDFSIENPKFLSEVLASFKSI